MRLEGTLIKYTKEDIENLSVYDYTQEEIDDQIEVAKILIRNAGSVSYPIFILSIILFLVALFTKDVNGTIFLACICIAPSMLVLALVLLANTDPERGEYYTQYLKVEVAEKRGIITKSWKDKNGKGQYNIQFFPMMVVDTKSGYRTRIYCFEDEYKNAKEGKRVKLRYRMSLKSLR